MKFIRGQDPMEGLGIGLKANPRPVALLFYVYSKSDIEVQTYKSTSKLLEGISKGEFKFGDRYAVLLRGHGRPYSLIEDLDLTPLRELYGQWIEWDSKIYFIPIEKIYFIPIEK